MLIRIESLWRPRKAVRVCRSLLEWAYRGWEGRKQSDSGPEIGQGSTVCYAGKVKWGAVYTMLGYTMYPPSWAKDFHRRQVWEFGENAAGLEPGPSLACVG